ncbi:MAG: peptidoglycan editing factor PgeF [Thermodesulforhabdaceae bacterium]|jgi:YfiH family protein
MKYDRSSPIAIPVSKNGFTMFNFQSLDSIPGLRYGIFGRSGGISKAPYDALNVAFSTGDSRENVLKNIELVRQELGFPFIVNCNQVHGTKIVIIDESKWSHFRASSNPIFLGDGDAMVTNLPNIGLMVKTGDCQAIILVDPKRHVVANVHCGWRGNVQNIAGLVVKAMKERFGSAPEDIIAAISPSLGPCCAEFVNYRQEIPEDFWRFKLRDNHFDLWAITTHELVAAGLKPYNVHVSGWCTRCHPEYFFSYRREKQSGRMPVVVGWKE